MKGFSKESLNIITSTILGLSLFIIIISIVFYASVSTFIMNIEYNTAIKITSNDDYIKSITNICNLKEDNLSKIYCVNDIYRMFFSYGTQKRINTVEFSLSNSTDCKNSSLFYCSIFRNMNLTCNLVHLDNHVYSVVEFEDGYCNIDQMSVTCSFYDEV